MSASASTSPRLQTTDLHASPPMPMHAIMRTVDTRLVRAPLERIFSLARDVVAWPTHLTHYRFVRYLERNSDESAIVEMSANRAFGPVNWPTWWTSRMWIDRATPAIRYRHIAGITTGMDVEWRFTPTLAGTNVSIIHLWNGPSWPMMGAFAATRVIGPIFVHGIASKTLAGLAEVAER